MIMFCQYAVRSLGMSQTNHLNAPPTENVTLYNTGEYRSTLLEKIECLRVLAVIFDDTIKRILTSNSTTGRDMFSLPTTQSSTKHL